MVRLLSLACAVGGSSSARAQVATATGAAPAPTVEPAPSVETTATADDAGGWGAFEDAASAAAPTKIFETRVYGYLDSYFAFEVNWPAGLSPTNEILRESFPYEFDVLSAHVMVQGSIFGRFRYFLNLAAVGLGSSSQDVALGVRNAWVETSLVGDHLVFRLGKTYRRFGLYNEILDATPTFIGVEAPEYLDPTNPITTRTTNLMLHGKLFSTDDWTASWALMTGNDERTSSAFPIGADLRATWRSALTVGSSFYWTGGDAVSGTAFGDGSPNGGVMPWMDRDEYYVIAGFAQLNWSGLIFQAEAMYAHHDATRNADAVRRLATSARFDSTRPGRFFVDGDPAKGPAPLDVTYDVFTTYFRLGYSLAIADVEVVPYIGATYYSNPETIADEAFGGFEDGAGSKDGGDFVKSMLGVVIRPVQQVALKLETTSHFYRYGGQFDWHQEGKLSLSYLWDLGI